MSLVMLALWVGATCLSFQHLQHPHHHASSGSCGDDAPVQQDGTHASCAICQFHTVAAHGWYASVSLLPERHECIAPVIEPGDRDVRPGNPAMVRSRGPPA